MNIETSIKKESKKLLSKKSTKVKRKTNLLVSIADREICNSEGIFCKNPAKET